MLCKGKVVSALINRVTLSQYCRVGQGNQTTKAPISILSNYMNDQSLRQGKAKQLCLKTTPFFPREKKSCLRWDSNHVSLHVPEELEKRGREGGKERKTGWKEQRKE